eukprot:11156850-Lingulodinium_polyedra.AAC.1
MQVPGGGEGVGAKGAGRAAPCPRASSPAWGPAVRAVVQVFGGHQGAIWGRAQARLPTGGPGTQRRVAGGVARQELVRVEAGRRAKGPRVPLVDEHPSVVLRRSVVPQAPHGVEGGPPMVVDPHHAQGDAGELGHREGEERPVVLVVVP